MRFLQQCGKKVLLIHCGRKQILIVLNGPKCKLVDSIANDMQIPLNIYSNLHYLIEALKICLHGMEPWLQDNMVK